MPNLEQSIVEWRRTMLAARPVSPATIDELENHLRETVDDLIRSGLTEADAFQRAATQLGGAGLLASEFQKLNQGTWLPVKVISAIGLLAALALAALLFARFGAGRLSLLLASHVFLVTLGYTTTLLIGALGICFVSHRCFAELSFSRRRALARVTFRLGCVATVLSAGGVILGMIWAKAEWGRYWAWDIKETGGLAVVVWQVVFLAAHWFARLRARALLLSLLGNVVVSLAWFGGNLASGLHSYGPLNYWLLLMAGVVFNLALLLMGLAPAGWLRPAQRC